jgi:hypothetical protein
MTWAIIQLVATTVSLMFVAGAFTGVVRSGVLSGALSKFMYTLVRILRVVVPEKEQPTTIHLVCTHASVPWPVMSGSDLVAWLCDECRETRPTFRCPPKKVRCAHLDYTEITDWQGGMIRRMCDRCGYSFTYTNVPDLPIAEMWHTFEGEQEKPTFRLVNGRWV